MIDDRSLSKHYVLSDRISTMICPDCLAQYPDYHKCPELVVANVINTERIKKFRNETSGSGATNQVYVASAKRARYNRTFSSDNSEFFEVTFDGNGDPYLTLGVPPLENRNGS